jgi:protein-disulfide isomerase
MKAIILIALAVLFATAAPAQKPDDILATANGHVFKLKDLSADTQKLVAEAPANYFKVRADLYNQIISMHLLRAEAGGRNTTTAQVILGEYAKVKDPTEAEIKKVYDENQAKLGGQTREQVRKQIVDYLRYEPQQKALVAFLNQLKTKYKFTPGKDVNGVLAPTDVIATVNGKPITSKEFDDFSRHDLFEARDQTATAVLADLNEIIQTALGNDEAKALGMDSGSFIAREITDKMKDYSDEERARLQNALSDRLYAKYKVNITYKDVMPPAENVSADDDPSTGPSDAPVTIIMFSDFQCSHCSATHPLLKEAMSSYPGKIRFVVRDCPLETIHPNAYRAALAAFAAHQQGKFFEYIDLLYKNQSALDDSSLLKYAAQLGLNGKQFEVDFKSEKAASEVKKDITDGENIGVHGTPTIFINGVRQRDFSVAGLRAAIDRALKK